MIALQRTAGAAQWHESWIGYRSVRTRLLADRADNAALGPRIVRRQLVFVREHFIVLRHRGYLTLRHHVHYLVAARLELADQFGDRLGGVMLEIVYQDDRLSRKTHRRISHDRDSQCVASPRVALQSYPRRAG